MSRNIDSARRNDCNARCSAGSASSNLPFRTSSAAFFVSSAALSISFEKSANWVLDSDSSRLRIRSASVLACSPIFVSTSEMNCASCAGQLLVLDAVLAFVPGGDDHFGLLLGDLGAVVPAAPATAAHLLRLPERQIKRIDLHEDDVGLRCLARIFRTGVKADQVARLQTHSFQARWWPCRWLAFRLLT